MSKPFWFKKQRKFYSEMNRKRQERKKPIMVEIKPPAQAVSAGQGEGKKHG